MLSSGRPDFPFSKNRRHTTAERERTVILLDVLRGVPGCAFLKLNGCSRVKMCCADIDGKTVGSEATAPLRDYCRVCDQE